MGEVGYVVAGEVVDAEEEFRNAVEQDEIFCGDADGDKDYLEFEKR